MLIRSCSALQHPEVLTCSVKGRDKVQRAVVLASVSSALHERCGMGRKVFERENPAQALCVSRKGRCSCFFSLQSSPEVLIILLFRAVTKAVFSIPKLINSANHIQHVLWWKVSQFILVLTGPMRSGMCALYLQYSRAFIGSIKIGPDTQQVCFSFVAPWHVSLHSDKYKSQF